MESALLLLLGAIVGVLADRVWRRVESRPRFKITDSHFTNIMGEKGIGLEVRNVGRVDISPYTLQLFHPLRGSLSMFSAKNDDKPLAPDEIREHEAVLFRNGVFNEMIRTWLTHERHQLIEEPRVDDFTFRITMKNGDRILFESPRMGRELAIRLLHTIGKGSAFHPTWNALRTPRPKFRPAWNRFKKTIGLKTDEELMLEKIQKEQSKRATGERVS
jgi:hypothetical protein